MCCFLSFHFYIQPYSYLTKKIYFHPMRKNPHGKILKGKPKEQHLSTVYKSYPIIIISLSPHSLVLI